MKQKTIVLCSSAAFYKHVNNIQDALEKKGFTVLVPQTAEKMRKTGDYDVSHYKTWYDNEEDFHKKALLMQGHFDEVVRADAVLVVNDDKNGIKGYIGPNVLMEMGLAFHLKKSIYVLNDIDSSMPVYEEVMGMGSVILHGDLEQIQL